MNLDGELVVLVYFLAVVFLHDESDPACRQRKGITAGGPKKAARFQAASLERGGPYLAVR